MFAINETTSSFMTMFFSKMKCVDVMVNLGSISVQIKHKTVQGPGFVQINKLILLVNITFEVMNYNRSVFSILYMYKRLKMI